MVRAVKKAPAKKKWVPKRCDHHYVWVLRGPGKVSTACAHCPNVSGTHEDVGSGELLERQCRASQEAHSASCDRPRSFNAR